MKLLFQKILHGLFFIVCVDLMVAGLWAWATVQTFEANVKEAPMAVVLNGDMNNKTGELGPETLRRLDHAVDLYRDGVIEYIFCVGGARPRFNVFGSESMRQYLIDEVVPEERIFIEKKSYDTVTNWRVAYNSVKSHEWNRMVAVSSPFHLHRFRQIIRDDEKRRLTVYFSPYSVKGARPRVSYYGIWKQVHYEWLAHFSQLLPEKAYDKLIDYIRGQ